MVDITKFFIVSQDQFNNIIDYLNCNINIDSDIYLITYLITNLFAIVVIYLSIKIILWIYYSFFSKRGNII